jgi:hypothetical protein
MKTNGFSYQDLELRLATTPEQRRDLVELRCKVYSAEFGNEDLTVVEDEFDPESTLFGAWQGEVPVGTVRCVPDGPLGLPLEADSGTRCDEWRKRGKICEVGRFAIPHRMGFNPFVIMGLLRLTFRYVMQNDISTLVCCSPQRTWPLYERMQMSVFGVPFERWPGQPFVLGALDFDSMLPRVHRDLERGLSLSMAHEILEQEVAEHSELVNAYLARRSF